MSFPAAPAAVSIDRARAGPRSQLPAHNYREKTGAAAAAKLVIDPSAGPRGRSALTAADPAGRRARRAEGGGPPLLPPARPALPLLLLPIHPAAPTHG